MTEHARPDTPATPIESASASTAPQTNDSKFAYLLTAGVLGGVFLIIAAIVQLVFAVVSAGYLDSYRTQGDAYVYDLYEENGLPSFEDRLDGLDEELWGIDAEVSVGLSA